MREDSLVSVLPWAMLSSYRISVVQTQKNKADHPSSVDPTPAYRNMCNLITHPKEKQYPHIKSQRTNIHSRELLLTRKRKDGEWLDGVRIYFSLQASFIVLLDHLRFLSPGCIFCSITCSHLDLGTKGNIMK